MSTNSPTREELIVAYFYHGYSYKVILEFLLRIHGHVLSLRQLKRLLKNMNLRRRVPNTPFHDQVISYIIQVCSLYKLMATEYM